MTAAAGRRFLALLVLLPGLWPSIVHGGALRVTSSDRIANWMPLYHDGGLVAGFIQPLVNGMLLSILSPIDWVHDPVLLLRAITADRSTLCWLPNFAYNFMATKISERKLAGVDLS